MNRLIWVAWRPASLQIHRRKAVIKFRFLKAAIRHRVHPTLSLQRRYQQAISAVIPLADVPTY